MNFDDKQLDDLLDRGLREYSQAEPREGLEGRILTNLRTQPSVRPWWHIWAPVLATAVVIAVVIALSLRAPKPQPRVQASADTVRIVQPTPQATVQPAVKPHIVAATPPHRREPRKVEVAAAAPPRLETFPSVTPATPEERMLLSFVRRRPDEARSVIAQREAAQERIRTYFETGRVSEDAQPNRQ